jgi:hypothetical protein
MYVYKAAQLKLIAQATMMLETFVITLYFVAILRIIKSVIVILSTSLDAICCQLSLIQSFRTKCGIFVFIKIFLQIDRDV